MRLWILSVRDVVGYDSYDAFVIRAETEDNARRMAASRAADEGEYTWLESDNSKCVSLSAEGEERIILGSFNAG